MMIAKKKKDFGRIDNLIRLYYYVPKNRCRFYSRNGEGLNPPLQPPHDAYSEEKKKRLKH